MVFSGRTEKKLSESLEPLNRALGFSESHWYIMKSLSNQYVGLELPLKNLPGTYQPHVSIFLQSPQDTF